MASAVAARASDVTLSVSAAVILWDSAPSNPDGMWSSSDPGKLTVPSGAGGRYQVTAAIQGNRVGQLKLLKNSTDINSAGIAQATLPSLSGSRNATSLYYVDSNSQPGDYFVIVYFTTIIPGGPTVYTGSQFTAKLF